MYKAACWGAIIKISPTQETFINPFIHSSGSDVDAEEENRTAIPPYHTDPVHRSNTLLSTTNLLPCRNQDARYPKAKTEESFRLAPRREVQRWTLGQLGQIERCLEG